MAKNNQTIFFDPNWDAPWELKLKALSLLAELKKAEPCCDWIGIYRKDGQELLVSVYIGEFTEHARIPISEGICGAAVRENQTLNIPDVRADPRFIACSIKTQSEIVIPIRNATGEAIAELDIDSNQKAAFNSSRAKAAEECAKAIENIKELWT